jgi:hypothetical protein
MKFAHTFDQFMQNQIAGETNGRRRERLEKGLGHGETEFLRTIWYPAVGHFDHLYPEWEVRDYTNGYRYIDLAYMPGDAKGAIEVQGYGSHARDIEHWRFKDLCIRHSHLALDGWVVMPFAYSSIIDAPKQCQQFILSLIGKFVTMDIPANLTWLESETIRYARRTLRPFSPSDLSAHLKISKRYSRTLLHRLVELKLLCVTSGQERMRTYKLLL